MATTSQIALIMVLFAIGGPLLVEAIGYFWHRGVEHLGWLGDGIRNRHWIHHEREYPTDSLRPADKGGYRSAGSWSWFALAGIVIAINFFVLPIQVAAPLSLGGVLYAWFIVSYFHKAFHIQGHWLNRFPWFHRLVRLHDIHHWVPANYGIVFFGMDRLFGTLRTEFPGAKEDLFPGFKDGHTTAA